MVELLSGLRVAYLHGFASSPGSRKAQFFEERLASVGVRMEIPDLAESRFERLTITGQLQVVEHLLAGQPAVLIGSSLGGYLAGLYAARHSEVKKLILLAPALGFHRLWVEELGPARLERWRKSGSMPIFHYGEEREVPLGYQLMADAEAYEPFPEFKQPALIFHGNQDPVVPIGQSLQFAQFHANVRLIALESGHELTDVLDTIWHEARSFLEDGGVEIE